MHEKLFHFLSIKISAKLNEQRELREKSKNAFNPFIVSYRQWTTAKPTFKKKSAERIFAVWKNPSTPIYCLFVCTMHNGEYSIAFLFLILLLLLYTAAAVAMKMKINFKFHRRWYNMCLDFSLLNIVTNRFSELSCM